MSDDETEPELITDEMKEAYRKMKEASENMQNVLPEGKQHRK